MTPKEILASYLSVPVQSIDGSRAALNSRFSEKVAGLYEKGTHDPNDPEVQKSYAALKSEILKQYNHLKDAGVKIEPWVNSGQPYTNSAEMIKDAQKGHLYYFPTAPDQISPDHPLAEIAPNHLMYNDMFRAVHDYFGHAVHGHQFGPQGEFRAWIEHSKMMGPEAKKALTTETHGQNSWVNFGPHRDLEVTKRPYATQKAMVLPVKLARKGTKDSFVWTTPQDKTDRIKVEISKNNDDPLETIIAMDNDLHPYVSAPYGTRKPIQNKYSAMLMGMINADIDHHEKITGTKVSRPQWYAGILGTITQHLQQWHQSIRKIPPLPTKLARKEEQSWYPKYQEVIKARENLKSADPESLDAAMDHYAEKLRELAEHFDLQGNPVHRVLRQHADRIQDVGDSVPVRLTGAEKSTSGKLNDGTYINAARFANKDLHVVWQPEPGKLFDGMLSHSDAKDFIRSLASSSPEVARKILDLYVPKGPEKLAREKDIGFRKGSDAQSLATASLDDESAVPIVHDALQENDPGHPLAPFWDYFVNRNTLKPPDYFLQHGVQGNHDYQYGGSNPSPTVHTFPIMSKSHSGREQDGA